MTKAARPARPRQLLRLRPGEEASSRGYLRLSVGRGTEERRDYIVPVLAQQNLILRPLVSGLDIRVCDQDAAAEKLGTSIAFGAHLRRRFTSLRRSVLRFGDVEVFPEGPGRRTRPYRKAVNVARHAGMAFDSRFVIGHPQLFAGFGAPAPRRLGAGSHCVQRIAVVLHLYYVDLWEEIETLLRGWRRPFTLIVTLNAENADLDKRIRSSFPDSLIRVVDNRGRDVRPFLLLLEDGLLDRFDIVCKIHGKRSLGGGRFRPFGEIMRRAAFLTLIADPGRVEEIVRRFADSPALGLVGSQFFLSSNGTEDRRDAIGPVNRRAVEALATRLGNPVRPDAFDFFEGTMFWVRPAALRALRGLALSREFAPEAGRLDGALEHAVERIFNHAVRATGYAVETVSV